MKKKKEEIVENKEEVIEVNDINSKDKTNTTLKVIIGILAFIIVIGCSFGAGYLGSELAKEEKEDEAATEEENDEKVNSEPLTKDSEVVKKLFEIFREDNHEGFSHYEYGNAMIDDINTSDASKKYVAYKQLDESVFGKKLCSEFKSKESEGGASCVHWELGEEVNIKTFPSSVLEAKYKEIFGEDAQFNNDDFSISFVQEAYYDKNFDLYAEYFYLDGDEQAPYKYTQTIDSIDYTDKTLAIHTTFVADGYDGEDDFGWEDYTYKITYNFKLEETTGNYIFVSRDKK